MKRIERYGFQIVREVVSESDCETLDNEINTVMQSDEGGRIENRQGAVVGARNLVSHPSLWNRWIADHRITSLIREHVGAQASVVRVLFFDKPPGQGWALSLHRDRTIAVAEHHRLAQPFSKPTRKAGVAHVEASDELLNRMLTLRLHLDPVRTDNGALFVVPRSHLTGSGQVPEIVKQDIEEPTRTIYCRAGDVFAMRPLLSHGSHAADPETQFRRRVLHVEIAPEDALPTPYHWHTAKRIFEERTALGGSP